MTWSIAVMVAYLAVLAVLSLNGLHRSWLLFVWSRRVRAVRPPDPVRWPVVTVQLPMFDERFVAERAIRSVAALDYPRGQLEIQVLDDSTDDTTEVARRVVEELRAAGHDVVLLHRTERTGFKAGALAAGLDVARGELVAVFDADFVPSPSFLRELVPWFADPRVGMVQARWGHLNADQDWLTRAQATLLDGHFVVEHTARHAGGRWFNFNGTAGVWRPEAIRDGGGWQHDTLTEDLDLSYRSQLAGWRFVYVPEVVAPAELPPDIRAFKAQQHRWAKGSVQTARKLLGRVWRAPVPVGIKLEATSHLCANFSYPLVVVLTLLLPFAVVARVDGGVTATPLLLVDLVLFVFALVPFVAFYGAAITASGAGATRARWARLPVVLAVGLGMAVSQSRAVLDGLGPTVGTFVRTPKTGGGSRGAWSAYRVPAHGLVVLELLCSAWLSAAFVYSAANHYWAALPFLALFAAGYALVGVSSLRT